MMLTSESLSYKVRRFYFLFLVWMLPHRFESGRHQNIVLRDAILLAALRGMGSCNELLIKLRIASQRLLPPAGYFLVALARHVSSSLFHGFIAVAFFFSSSAWAALRRLAWRCSISSLFNALSFRSMSLSIHCFSSRQQAVSISCSVNSAAL